MFHSCDRFVPQSQIGNESRPMICEIDYLVGWNTSSIGKFIDNGLKNKVGDKDKLEFRELRFTQCALINTSRLVIWERKLICIAVSCVFSLTSCYFGRTHSTFSTLTLAVMELFDCSQHLKATTEVTSICRTLWKWTQVHAVPALVFANGKLNECACKVQDQLQRMQKKKIKRLKITPKSVFLLLSFKVW